MKLFEVKNINTKSAFKAALMASVIPMIIFTILGLLTALASLQSVDSSNSSGGGLLLTLGYLIFYFILCPILFGLFAMLYAASYNWLAKKHSGLKITISEQEIIANEVIDPIIKNKVKILDQSLKEGLISQEEYNNKLAGLK